MKPARVLFLFLDGVGIGEPDPEVNPFFRARLPTLAAALGGRLPSSEVPAPAGPKGRAFPVDACLGVPGTPQSGTGQIALFTGRNAPAEFGRHFGPWPPVRLRELLDQENFLRRAADRGRRVAFANAYPRGYPGTLEARRLAVPPLAALSAGALTRDQDSLAAGDAVASEILNDGWRAHLGPRIPRLTAEEAGGTLARIHALHDLTVFAHYHTDLVGHRGGIAEAATALETVDRFLAGVMARVDDDTLILVASDHGNIEDARVGHTRNPSLGLAIGRGALELTPPASLLEVAELVLDLAGG